MRPSDAFNWQVLRKEERDNPTIGLLIYRDKNNPIAQYALEASNLPLGISEYELSKIYPEKLEGTIPTIDELEKGLENMENKVGSWLTFAISS